HIVDMFKKALDVHSPSRIFMAIGADTIKGLQLGMEAMYPAVYDSVGDLGNKLAGSSFAVPGLAGGGGGGGAGQGGAGTTITINQTVNVTGPVQPGDVAAVRGAAHDGFEEALAELNRELRIS